MLAFKLIDQNVETTVERADGSDVAQGEAIAWAVRPGPCLTPNGQRSHCDGDGSVIAAVRGHVQRSSARRRLAGCRKIRRAHRDRRRNSSSRRARAKLVKIEVEVDKLARSWVSLRDAALLDNMSVDELQHAMAMIAGRATTEASCRVTPATAPASPRPESI
ncbi:MULTISPECIES: hypothetical protein [unclassified Mesorhizobium]|uniref:hypothetical protein n=1 Tax=unclassified Mesorhizobium TaxID=325217 RepID=UPI001FDEF4C4|nr:MULTISPECIES: hypothetical protein [unclassified Mesorhizobium]